jgi:dihydrolipoamide dehydrogenase
MPAKSLIIIGGGPGGYAAALEAARRKMTVTLVERQDLGGTCLNRGCIPTKFLLTKAKQCVDALRLADSGIQFRLEKISMRPLLDQKDAVVKTLRQRIEQALKSASVERIVGNARLLSPHQVEIVSPGQPTQAKEANAILLATGSSPIMPELFPKIPCILNSTEILDISYLPAHLVVVGGGYIGCEFACAFHGLGSKVTLIEKEPKLLATQPEFETAGTILQRIFEKRSMTVWTRTEVQTVTSLDNQRLHVSCSNGETFEANALLLALGRIPNVENLGLEAVGLRLQNQRLQVNEFMQTAIPSIYAVGDMVSPVPLAHVASREATVAISHLDGEPKPMSYIAVPRCIYTWPEAAAVGWTEEQAKAAGHDVRVDRYHLAGNAKAMAEQEMDGLWITVSDVPTHKILGGQIVGPHATELIHLLALCLRAGLTSDDIADMVFAHPTLSEGLQEAMLRGLAAARPTSNVRGPTL